MDVHVGETLNYRRHLGSGGAHLHHRAVQRVEHSQRDGGRPGARHHDAWLGRCGRRRRNVRRSQRNSLCRQRYRTGNELAGLPERDVHGPVVAAQLGEFTGAVERIDNPDPLRAQPHRIICALLVWIGSLVFAALGVFIGYLLPAENVMQILGIVLALFSFLGGLLIPLSQLSSGVQEVAKFTPLFGLNQLVHVPLVGGGIQLSWVLNLVVWFAIFVGGATWRLRLDTARV